MAWQSIINGACNACGMGAPTSTSIILPLRRRRIRWRTKHYLSVAMVGALVAIALVAAISISLAPAHLTFSVVKADVIPYLHYGPGIYSNNTHLNFTLHVENDSPRTAVWYGSISGEVSYGPAATAWVRFSNQSGIWQAPRSPVDIFFSADYGYSESTLTLGSVESCRILMVSKVRFAWLGLPTLPYTVRLSCEAVNFVDKTNFPVSCA